ncbi:NmrA family transcriptional regulator [Streptomyces sp. NPDC097727]|uniref:NmrA family transcriptional regulator n=1 Tax=Streptomyces sp. NPDC097727 TaxID=3366092 RepID=UPI0037FFC1B5
MTQNTENVQRDTVLVTSGTGKTGRRVVERLAARGVAVRAGSRSAEVRFDWADESGWAPALRGADAAYVTYYPDLAAPGAPEAMAAFGRIAAENGVRRLVLLSGRGEPQAVVAEESLRRSAAGAELTVVRSAFFAQNFSEGAMLDGVLGGEVVFPAGGTAEPFVDIDDLADVVVAALTEDGHAGAVHELTGPRLLTFDEVVSEIASATGRAVRYLPVSGAEYAQMLEGYGVPGPEAGFLADLFTMLLDGHNATVTEGVKQVLGRDPKDFGAFARAAAQSGAWKG